MDILLKIFIAFVVIENVQSQLRRVVNTTCLELANPSNLQFRLSCSKYVYHCLLDETFTNEFEVCRGWKWIPEGSCAYFNTYGEGNIDGRPCVYSANLVCPTKQYSSQENTKYTACYAKNVTSPVEPRISSIQATSNMTSYVHIATASPVSTAWISFLLYIIGIAVILSISAIFFIHRYLGKRLCKKDNTAKGQGCDPVKAENEIEKNEESIDAFLDASESLPMLAPPTEKHQVCDEDKFNVNEAENGESGDSTTDDTIKGLIYDKEKISESSSGSGYDPVKCDIDAGNDDTTKTWIGDKETSSENTSSVDQGKSDDEENKEESTDVFSDNIESLQKKAPITDVQAKSMCAKLFNLLDTEGLKLTQKVMTATITRETGKSVETLVNNLSDQDENKWKEALPAESYRILKSKQEHSSSFHVFYGLHRIFLDEKHHPKSGWGNPVRGTDIGIGDDIERLYRIQTIVCGISDPLTVSVESYIRLLDIMVESLTRLDIVCEFKKNYKTLSTELTYIKNQTFTQKMIKDIQYMLTMW